MLKDNTDWEKESEQDIRARVGTYMAFTQVLLKGYHALKNYGVDFMALPEWKEDSVLDEARKMKPVPGQALMVGWITRLEHGIEAAVRRKSLRGLNGGKVPPVELDPKDTKH